jgi:hypothetical protein
MLVRRDGRLSDVDAKSGRCALTRTDTYGQVKVRYRTAIFTEI